MILFRGEQVLLIRRGKPPNAGHWSLPGGGQELGETVEDTARRELLEETGMTAAGVLVLVDVVDSIHRDDDGRVRFHYTLVDFAGFAGPEEPVAGGDSTAVAWIAPDALPALGLWDKTRAVIARARALLAGPHSA